MKLNYVGIIGAIIAFVSIALPWWTVSETALGLGATYNWYLYNAGVYGTGLNLWYDWVALLLVIVAGIIALAGSIIPNYKKMLIGGGLLALVSMIIFAAGLQNDLSSQNSPFGIFFSGTVFDVSFSTYLSYGFWLALVAAIIMLLAMLYPKPAAQAPAPPLISPPSQPPSQPPSPPPSSTGT